MSEPTNLYLLVCNPNNPGKAVPIEFSRSIPSDDFGTLYRAFDRFCKVPAGSVGWSTCHRIYREDITPQGIPYECSLCCDGGIYTLWHLEQPEEVLQQAKDYLRHTFDVVKIYTQSIALVEWTPPEPFKAIELPKWVSRKPETDS